MGKALPLAALGVFVGGLLGFLMRPAAPLIGQLDFGTVISRGTNLTGLDSLLISTAQASFNYLVVGAILGAVVGIVIGLMMTKNKPATS
ncbi:MAG: hypothetical protein LC802_17275 [Acidobacteria bacterium]|nr:hypothetical protein [Acidobacteriota bacterium]